VILTNFQPVPEPAHILIVGLGFMGIARWRRARRIAASSDLAA
jgi:hypothetical protein